MPAINVKVKLLKEMYHLELDPEAPVIEFRKALEEKTYIPPSGQRLKVKGKLLPTDLEMWDDYKEVLIEGALFMIMQ